MLGSGHGSWQVRGQQLGLAMGARVMHTPSAADLAWADIVVVVKRAIVDRAEQVHQAGKPLVWDALDFWQQPDQNHLSRTESEDLLRAWIGLYRPAVVVGATEAMATAAGGLYLPHHAWLSLSPHAIQADVRTVAYEGTKKYLGRWAQWIHTECDRRDWTFVINPPDLRVADLVVAFRDGPWDGWMCQEWKSGVKLVNAMRVGRPVVTQPSAAFRELSPIGSAVEDVTGLRMAFDQWAYRDERARATEQPRANALVLDQVAARYRLLLQAVSRMKAA